MMLENEKKIASVSTEFAIGIALAVVVLFVALGLFYDNLSGMLTNTKLTNFFGGNNSKTQYSAFNRNYSDSEINVQVMGEQGLEMLRKKANNKVIELIENSFNNTNPDGDSIAYLAVAIKAMVGESNVCVYMKKDSDKHCDEDDLGGYKYNVELGDSAVTITKQNTDGSNLSPSESIVLDLSSNAQNVLSSAASKITTTDGVSTLTEDEKYSFIKDISTKLTNCVRSDALLIRDLTTFNTSIKSASSAPPTITGSLKQDLIALLSALGNSVNAAHQGCTTYLLGGDLAYPQVNSKCCDSVTDISTSSQCWVGYEENNAFKVHVASLSNTLQSETAGDSDLVNTFINGLNDEFYYKRTGFLGITISSNNYKGLEIINNDHYNDITSCDVLKNGLTAIKNNYNLSITIPTCKASVQSD